MFTRILLALLAALRLQESPPLPPDFTGHWKLVGQETRATGRRGHVGNHEEPLTITQSGNRLLVSVDSRDPAGKFEYDLSGAVRRTSGPNGEKLSSESRWKGEILTTTGSRMFTTDAGAKAYDFTESRELVASGNRMVVTTRIDMFPTDLIRTSTYERIP